jgi:hypothetical protein
VLLVELIILEEYDKEVGEVLSQSDHLQFVRRWNMFQFKLDNARKFLSLNNFNSSFAFVRSLHYDSTSLHRLIHSAGQRLYTYLYCEQVLTTILRLYTI